MHAKGADASGRRQLSTYDSEIQACHRRAFPPRTSFFLHSAAGCTGIQTNPPSGDATSVLWIASTNERRARHFLFNRQPIAVTIVPLRHRQPAFDLRIHP